MVQLDDRDRVILRLLKEKCRFTASEANPLEKPKSTMHFRIGNLLKKDVIDGYTVTLDETLRPKAVASVCLDLIGFPAGVWDGS